MENKKNTYALIIGVGADLPYTVNDANNLYTSLTDKKRIGYPKENVIVLTEEKANREGILNAFDELKDKSNEDSTILIYYSGHGGTFKDEHKFWIQPYGMTAENYLETWVTAEELRDKINALPSGKLVLFLDCCHAEGLVQSGIKGLYGMAQKLNDEDGIWVVASCQDNQESYGYGGNSFFTECLLEVLAGEHKRPFIDPEVSIMDVVEYLFEEVPERAKQCVDDKNNPCIQTPFFKTQMSENLILSYFPKNEEDYQTLISDLEPKANQLDEERFIRLINALEAVGRVEDAIAFLKKHPKINKDPDLLESLGDMHCSVYLDKRLQKDGEHALKCFKEAYKLAVSQEDEEQVFTNAIKIAFMYAKLDLSKKEMRSYAMKAKKAAEDYLYDSQMKWVTIAEASIYLGKLDESKENYKKVAEETRIRFRMHCYEKAFLVYTTLYRPKSEKEPFLEYLKDTLLS